MAMPLGIPLLYTGMPRTCASAARLTANRHSVKLARANAACARCLMARLQGGVAGVRERCPAARQKVLRAFEGSQRCSAEKKRPSASIADGRVPLEDEILP